MLKSLDRAFEKFRYQSRLKWGSFQWNRIGGGRTEPRNGKKSGRKMETICSTSVNPSGRLNMTSLNCFSYYVYISNILSFYYIIKLGSPTLFPTILKISIENFGHRRENQETRESRMPFIACTIVRNSRPTCTNFERRNKFSEIRRNHGRYFRDSSRIKDFTRGGRREGRKETYLNAAILSPRERCRVACFITVHFFPPRRDKSRANLYARSSRGNHVSSKTSC